MTEQEARGRCKEFYDKWEREPNWCEKCDSSASRITAYIDLTSKFQSLRKYKESYFRRVLFKPQFWSKLSENILLKEVELQRPLNAVDMSQVISATLKLPQGNFPTIPKLKYQTLVIDPPWQTEKILREVRPNQKEEFDYPTMTIDEIKALPIKDLVHENCHVYLWTTHKYLPTAFEVFRFWDVKYECLLTWVKNVGFTPFSWMYSTEHILFGRIGNLELLMKGKRLDFKADVREHSRKPNEFYELVREVSPEPRLDMFAREKHEGFIPWGNEIDKFNV